MKKNPRVLDLVVFNVFLQKDLDLCRFVFDGSEILWMEFRSVKNYSIVSAVGGEDVQLIRWGNRNFFC